MTKPLTPESSPDSLWPGASVGHDARVPWAWLTFLTLVALALRLIALNQQLWYDEMVTLIESVRQPLATILTTYSSQNQHTLYSVLARGSILLLGEHPWTLRLPAVLFGVGCVPALYLCARQMTNRREALLASALLTVSYHHVWFSQNARGYTGLVFFTLLATYFFIRGARQSRISLWIGYGLAVGLGIFTHLMMAFVALGHGLVYLWLVAARRRQLGRWPRSSFLPLAGFALAGLISLLLYAPTLPDLVVHNVASARSTVQSEWSSLLWLALETLRGVSAGMGGKLWMGVAAGLILLAGFMSYGRAHPYFVALWAVPVVVTGGMMILLAHNYPRFFFFAVGFGLILLVRGALVGGERAARVLRRDPARGVQWGTVLVMVMVAGSVGSLPTAYRYPKQEFLAAMEFVLQRRQAREPVVVVGLTKLPYQRYYGRDWPAVATRTELEAIRSRGQPVWLLYTLPIHVKSRHPEVWDVIQSDFTTVRVFRGTLGGGEIYVCRSPV